MTLFSHYKYEKLYKAGIMLHLLLLWDTLIVKKQTNKIEQTKLADMENKSCISRISKGKKTSVAYVNTHTHIYVYT